MIMPPGENSPRSLVLVTGSAGRVGQAVVAALEGSGLRVRGFDLKMTSGASEAIVGDVTDSETVQKAVQGAGTIIHLAATPDDDDFFSRLLPNNIAGLYHVMEAARSHGARRLVLASTGQVNWWQRIQGPWPVKPTDPPSPKYWYAATKMFLEAIGRGYAENHGIEVIVARLGWCPRTKEQAREIEENPWAQDVYLSPRDAGRFYACAVRAQLSVRFVVCHVTSKPIHTQYFDLDAAKTLLGYEPVDAWPAGTEIFQSYR